MKEPYQDVYRFGVLYVESDSLIGHIICGFKSTSDFMIAPWENKCISPSDPSVVRVQFPAAAEYLKEFSFG